MGNFARISIVPYLNENLFFVDICEDATGGNINPASYVLLQLEVPVTPVQLYLKKNS